MAIIKHKSQRVGIFIDTQNLYHSAKNLYKSKVNFGNVVAKALAGRQLIRAIAYVIRTESEEEKGFFEALNKLGIETKVKDIRVFAGGAKKADWDIGMAIDAIAMSEKLDAIVLATGDGDFVPLVEYLKYTQGTQVEVIAFGKSAAGVLRESVDDFIDMCDNPKEYLIGYRGGGRWIPSFTSGSNDRPQNADTSPLNTEAKEDFEDMSGDGEDPAIKMSGE
ncbi:MAG TPA: NYN domain-containing protein [Candidatus Paceibacterota bacterium]|nr:NYN domain-containing protein [Candidatus Paceibacterota bacterium]